MAYAPLATGLLSGTYAADVPPPEDSLWGSRRRDRFAETLTGRAADVLSVVRAGCAQAHREYLPDGAGLGPVAYRDHGRDLRRGVLRPTRSEPGRAGCGPRHSRSRSAGCGLCKPVNDSRLAHSAPSARCGWSRGSCRAGSRGISTLTSPLWPRPNSCLTPAFLLCRLAWPHYHHFVTKSTNFAQCHHPVRKLETPSAARSADVASTPPRVNTHVAMAMTSNSRANGRTVAAPRSSPEATRGGDVCNGLSQRTERGA